MRIDKINITKNINNIEPGKTKKIFCQKFNSTTDEFVSNAKTTSKLSRLLNIAAAFFISLFVAFNGNSPKEQNLGPHQEYASNAFEAEDDVENVAESKPIEVKEEIIESTQVKPKFIPPKTITNNIPFQKPYSFLEANTIYKDVLRGMQYNNGKIPPRFLNQYKGQYNLLLSKYPDLADSKHSAHEYATSCKRGPLMNLTYQKQDLAKMKPSKEESILWKGIKFSKNGVNYKNIIDYENLLTGLKPNNIAVLDWSAMSASEDFDKAFKNSSGEVLRIKVPAGAKLYNDNSKVIFPSKAAFKFINKQEYDNLTVYNLEYLPS